MALDIDERHLLRMGHGEESLETEKDFSRLDLLTYLHCAIFMEAVSVYITIVLAYSLCL